MTHFRMSSLPILFNYERAFSLTEESYKTQRLNHRFDKDRLLLKRYTAYTSFRLTALAPKVGSDRDILQISMKRPGS